MRRREFIALLGGAAAVWPLAARAQQASMPVIGYLESATTSPPNAAAFHAGLKEAGFVEGQNVAIEYRNAEAQYDRLPALAADLVARQVSLIVARGAVVSPLAARAVTTTIPIVFLVGVDPVRTGLVASLNRPGGNITGITAFGSELSNKRMELLADLLPKARGFAVLINPNNPSHVVDKARWQSLAIGVPIETVSASTESDFEPSIAGLAEKQIDAVYVVPDTLFGSKRDRLVSVLTRHRMPAIFSDRDSAVAGGLLSYGASLSVAHHQLGIYVGRILKGEKLADLPVLQPTKLDMIINLKTAKALGLTVPASLLVQAAEVIE